MKTRQGFVSNSSSSSFIINRGDIKETALGMLNIIIEDFEDNDYTPTTKDGKKKERELHKKWMANLKIALKNQDVKEGKIGITMPSCNYETYLLMKDGIIYIATSRNHQWDINERSVEDSDRHEELYSVIRSSNYFNIRNKKIHSHMEYNDSIDKSKCPDCNRYYGNYVITDNGDRLCASCYTGILEPTLEVKLQRFREKGISNPITSMKLDEE